MRSWFFSRFLLTVSLVFPTALCLGLLYLRKTATGEFRYPFLVWNLFLAVLPVPLGLLTDALIRRRRWCFGLIPGFLWLLFLPNSPYLVTDLVHLEQTNVPYWYDTLLYGSFAITGVLLGFGSVALIHTAVRDRFNRVAGWVTALTSLGLSAFGIYLGRIERWNSWNIVGNPRSLAKSVLAPIRSPFDNVRTVGFVFLYSAFLVIGYLSITVIGVLLSSLTDPMSDEYRPAKPRPAKPRPASGLNG